MIAKDWCQNAKVYNEKSHHCGEEEEEEVEGMMVDGRKLLGREDEPDMLANTGDCVSSVENLTTMRSDIGHNQPDIR